jgi:hypothetical protein
VPSVLTHTPPSCPAAYTLLLLLQQLITHMQVPSMTTAHSATSCQCSSRRPPGFSWNNAPAMVLAVSVAFVLALKRPPGYSCQGTLENASMYCSCRAEQTRWQACEVHDV